MRKLRHYFLFCIALMFCGCRLFAAPSITNVKAEPTSWGTWITYSLSETVSENDYSLVVSASNRQSKTVVFASAIAGDLSLKKGTHIVQWNTVKDNIRWNNAMIDFRVLIVEAVQLWENGPYWAKCNVGATKPEDYGYYFAWGATVMNPSKGYSTTVKSGSSRLGNADDAATQNCGLMWRMPIYGEGADLIAKTTKTATTINNIKGYLIKGKGNFAGRSIFLPAAGLYVYESKKYSDGSASTTYTLTNSGSSYCYWTADPGSLGSSYATAIMIGSSSDYQWSNRHNCLPIRPVLKLGE